MARDDIFKTDKKIFISAVTVRELIHEDNTSLTFNSEMEEAMVQKQTLTNQKNQTIGKIINPEKTSNEKIQSTF